LSMDNQLMIAVNLKKFILTLNDILINIPKKEYYIKNKIQDESYDLLRKVFFVNNLYCKNRKQYMKDLLAGIAMLDFYMEYLYEKKCISLKQCNKKVNELRQINKMVHGWAKSVGKLEQNYVKG